MLKKGINFGARLLVWQKKGNCDIVSKHKKLCLIVFKPNAKKTKFFYLHYFKSIYDLNNHKNPMVWTIQ